MTTCPNQWLASYRGITVHAITLWVFALGVSSTVQAQGPEPGSASSVVLILDASGSMWEQLDGGYKIRIAQGALKNLAAELSDNTRIGLIAYGHRRESDCSDIQTLVPLGSIDRATLGAEIDALNPVGRTPITESIRQAVEMLAETEGPASVVLVSDGLETCGGDPCQLVRDTRAQGVNIVMHVVGFGVGEVDTSQLECTAQAGGGRYISAQDAEELAAALRTTVEAPPVVGGWLSIGATKDGELIDVAINVITADGVDAGGGRTYASPQTNPRIIPLPAGSYQVQVGAVGLRGETRRTFEDVLIANDQTAEYSVDFSAGELSVGMTNNGELLDAGIRVYTAGTNTEVAAGRAYDSPRSNPRLFNLTVGTYDVVVGPLGVSGVERARFEGITVEAGQRSEISHAIVSGTLRVRVTNGEALTDAAVYVLRPDDNLEVARKRTYTADTSNPGVFQLLPGRYVVRVRGIRMDGDPQREIEVVVAAGSTVERSVDLGGR